jgi:hypothetical protein
MTDDEFNQRFDQIMAAVRSVQAGLDLQQSRERLREAKGHLDALMARAAHTHKPTEDDIAEDIGGRDRASDTVFAHRLRALRVKDQLNETRLRQLEAGLDEVRTRLRALEGRCEDTERRVDELEDSGREPNEGEPAT